MIVLFQASDAHSKGGISVKRIAAVVCVSALALLLCCSCLSSGESSTSESSLVYQGKELTPLETLPDNSILGPQSINIESYRLKVFGRASTPVELTYQQVLALNHYEKFVTLYCVEGWDAAVVWKGVRIADIIEKAEADVEAVTVIFHSADGYTTSLPLKRVVDMGLILAFQANYNVLPESMGFPFIVVAEDTLGYKWARWVTGIELSDDPDYRGYWEQRGYDNDAKLWF